MKPGLASGRHQPGLGQGFRAQSIAPINNPPEAFRVAGTRDCVTTRRMRNAWFMPFCRSLDIRYPSGLRHIIFNSATPVGDVSIQLVQIRNDREEDGSTQELIDWDAAIIAGCWRCLRSMGSGGIPR
jgi:hypothetical protein